MISERTNQYTIQNTNSAPMNTPSISNLGVSKVNKVTVAIVATMIAMMSLFGFICFDLFKEFVDLVIRDR